MRANTLLHGLLALSAGFNAACMVAQVQSPTTTLPVEWITVDDGLPQGMVRAILQDRTGYLWFGTKDGLARSDGYGYTVFRHDERDSMSLCADHISALHEDRAGRLWVGTEAGAVDRYDPRTGGFAHMMRTVPDPLSSGQAVLRFVENAHGQVLALMATSEVVALPDAPIGSVKKVARDIVDMAFDPSGALWLISRDELVIATLTAQLAMDDQLRLPVRSNTVGLLADSARSRMLLVGDGLVLALNVAAPERMDTIASGLGIADRNSYFLDGSYLWMNCIGSLEATRLSLTTGLVERIRFDEANGRQLPQEPLALTFAKDRSGNLWVGTTGYGVLLYRALTGRFHRLLQGSSPWLSKADRDGHWIVADDELFWLNSPDGFPQVTEYGQALSAEGRLASWYGFRCDRAGVWWACITVRDEANHLMYHVPDVGDGLHAMALDSVEEPLMLINCESDDLWILANGKIGSACDRLIRFDPIARRITARYVLPFPLPPSDYRMVSALLIAHDGTLWMGTRKGLLELRAGAHQWIVHTHDPADPSALPSERIFSLCFDPDRPDQALWVGTEESGLARMDVRTGACRNFGIHEGLPNNTIYAILSDAHHNLWVSTNRGLCRFDPRSHAVRTFSRTDGIAGTEFNRYSAAIAEDGRFFFAGTNGITWFDPNTMYGDAEPSPTVITGLALANTPVLWNSSVPNVSDAFVIPAPPDHLASLSLPYAQRSLTLSFACMDLSVPLKNRFRYKLEGFHNDWVDAGTAHEATFTNLDPGTYTFRVQGRNSADVWDERGTSLELIIAPPWWGTWWFRGAVLLLLGGGLYTFYRYRLSQTLKVVTMRERIARDLHDEIGSTLSSVSLYSSVAQKKVAQKAPEANELLGRISESTTQVLESINDIVWAVNADNDDMDHLVQRMRDYAMRMTETRGCALHFDQDPALRALPLKMAARKNLYLVFKEAVNNAVKYSDCHELRVTMERDGTRIVLRIMDDGKGFEPEAATSTSGGGNGLPNMRKRAAELGATLHILSAPGKGTAIELRFSSDARPESLDTMTGTGRATG